MKSVFLLIAVAFSFSVTALEICKDTVVEYQGNYGKEYFTLAPRFSSDAGRSLSVIRSKDLQSIKITVTNLDGSTVERQIPVFYYSRVLLIKDSVWFLADDKLIEYNISENKIAGTYPSYTKPFEAALTTKARGFTHFGNYLYIAHGEFGVVLFDLVSKKPYTTINAGVAGGSLAAAVEVHGSTLYVLQGAFHPNGFNGLSIYDLKSGGTKLVGYPAKSGVVDPYTSTMTAGPTHLFINNSGWIHTYEHQALKSAGKTLEPKWIPVAERISGHAGDYDTYLMVNGDLLVKQNEVTACSSVSYIPKGQRRPITESRTLKTGTP